MAVTDPEAARRFATEVVRTLHEAGFLAYWAGGCVRDQLLGQQPSDYDVATSAVPDEIRRVFGRRRTLAIGAAFGVITVLGPRPAGQVEVATFRQDAAYSDGRHPDSVSYSTPEEDARRRDFTVNGMFFDPMSQSVLDLVGGRQDLADRVVRAIGDPLQRFAEDKLRLLRAVRFAATLGFSLEPTTRAAVVQQAGEIVQVSAERIAGELRRMFAHPERARAAELLRQCRLLTILLPEMEPVVAASQERPATEAASWRRTLGILHDLPAPSFAACLAALLRETAGDADRQQQSAREIGRRLRFTNAEVEGAVRLLREDPLVRQASRLPWPQLQRLLVADGVQELLSYSETVARVLEEGGDEIDYCRRKLQLPAQQLDPPPLVTGDDLKRLGIPPGPVYRTILDELRDQQLQQRIGCRSEALRQAELLWKFSGKTP